ncbi:PfkB family carbohydrate kinase [uncultured Bosea sp.]|uniref:PfkB family carbohydrate kinase n=1 Tax=uncultured Bosea sp. TaxID=211457 RepID=UPI0025FEAA58|nr:PfkB family carbohydrate kinase [uncultured Bosea sp.]
MTGKSIFVLGSFVVACSAKVPRFPRPGESLAAETVTIEPGGKGLNQAIMARRLGAEVDGLLAVGDDLAAAFAAPALERAGLPPSMLIRLEGSTGSGIGFTDATGETCLAVASGANLALTAEHVGERAQAIADAALVTAQFEIADAPIEAAFALARQAGVPTLLNPSPFRPIPAAIMALASILIVNETEASAVAAALDRDENEAADPRRFTGELGPALLELGPRLVILTRGAAGAVAVTADASPVSQEGFRVEPVDALGAGDAFAATLGVRLAMGLPLPAALREAAAAGALTTTRQGVFDALPTLAAIEALTADKAGSDP